MRGTARHDRFVLAVGAFFIGAHLAWLPRHLEDIDSINFALGLRHYDVAAHQPHPPGYPAFTLIARGAAALVSPFTGDLGTRDAIAMALVASLAGGIALLALYRLLCLVLRDTPTHDAAGPLMVTALTASTPLFWITASRPLSDMPGLAGALVCQLLLIRAASSTAPATPALRSALWAALACGVATGLRSQVTWLVMPMLAWLCLRVWQRADLRAAIGVAAAALGGVFTWAVPMVMMTGGVAAFRTALTSQAGEDFEGVPMLVLQPGARRLVQALADTFVSPWGWWPIAALSLAIAAAGVVALRGRGRLVTWLGLGYVPYVAYHLLFQETETTRYALPVVPLVATLLVLGLVRWTPRLARPAAAVVCGLGLAVSLQAHQQYTGAGRTVSEVLHRMDAAAAESAVRPQVLMHRRVWAETRRARAAITPSPSFDVIGAPRAHEWQAAVTAWQRRGTPLWWMVDPRRGDRVAVDPRALRLREHVAWPMPVASLLGGMRPHAFDWYDVVTPQWVLIDGWGLSPELAGLSAAAGQGPSGSGATALLRAQAGSATLVVGGRFVAPPGTTGTLVVRIGETWQQPVPVPAGPFVFTWPLPAGALAGRAPIMLRASAIGTVDSPHQMYLEQFDLQPSGVPVLGLERGWYEPERDTVSGRQWRWVGDQSTMRVSGAAGDVRVEIAGTYPRHYDRDPVLEIFAGAQRIASHTLARPFAIDQVITARQLSDDGRLTWRVTPSFVAGERTGSADARRLALEIATLRVHAVR